MDDQLTETERTRLHRKHERGHFDRTTINSILDEAIHCTVAFAQDGRPFAIPMVFARIDNDLYLHGAVANRMLTAMTRGAEICVSVTLIDALVLSRSLFRQSVNYRCVMLFGVPDEVNDNPEKLRVLNAVVEHVIPGRSSDVRPPSRAELDATRVMRLPIVEGSAKISTGGRDEAPNDVALPIWAGRVPIRLVAGEPVPENNLQPDIPTPGYATAYTRPSMT